MASSYQQIRQEEEEENNAMAALMRSTDEETETNCKLSEIPQKVRESKKRNSSKV